MSYLHLAKIPVWTKLYRKDYKTTQMDISHVFQTILTILDFSVLYSPSVAKTYVRGITPDPKGMDSWNLSFGYIISRLRVKNKNDNFLLLQVTCNWRLRVFMSYLLLTKIRVIPMHLKIATTRWRHPCPMDTCSSWYWFFTVLLFVLSYLITYVNIYYWKDTVHADENWTEEFLSSVLTKARHRIQLFVDNDLFMNPFEFWLLKVVIK